MTLANRKRGAYITGMTWRILPKLGALACLSLTLSAFAFADDATGSRTAVTTDTTPTLTVEVGPSPAARISPELSTVTVPPAQSSVIVQTASGGRLPAWIPALTYPQAAYPVAPGVWQCWNQWGGVIPQAASTCPPGWGGRPPENPLPIGTTYVAVP